MTGGVFARLLARIEAGTSGYLPQMGWIESRATRKARDAQGNAVPWFTYPAIEFLRQRVRPTWRVLEFGAGGGTSWWCAHAGQVTAVEHHAGWAKSVAAACRAEIIEASEASAQAYSTAASARGPFEVVVVDGLFRPECLALAPSLLAEGGVIVLDDAQREEYAAATQALVAQGFRYLPLHGPQPVSKHPGCTAFLYRDGNVLGL